MKLGLIVRSDRTGLGYQTQAFYKHLKPDRTLLVDISHLNGNKQNPDWYPDAEYSYGFPSNERIDIFLDGLDVVLTAESPYNYYLYSRARELGIRSVVQYNYEFFDWFIYNYPRPDVLIAPTMWGFDRVDEFAKREGIEHLYLHCPVDRQEFPFRRIETAHRFLHVVGKPATRDRNGTESLLHAMDYVTADIEVIVTSQDPTYLEELKSEWDFEKRVIFRHASDNRQDLYADCDAMVLPRRYGGNCLPLNEALSCGMPVIMPRISPNTEFLPDKWLVHAKKIDEFIPRIPIDIFDVNVKDLAARIDLFAKGRGMGIHNSEANRIAETISWEKLLPKYQAVLCP